METKKYIEKMIWTLNRIFVIENCLYIFLYFIAISY